MATRHVKGTDGDWVRQAQELASVFLSFQERHYELSSPQEALHNLVKQLAIVSCELDFNRRPLGKEGDLNSLMNTFVRMWIAASTDGLPKGCDSNAHYLFFDAIYACIQKHELWFKRLVTSINERLKQCLSQQQSGQGGDRHVDMPKSDLNCLVSQLREGPPPAAVSLELQESKDLHHRMLLSCGSNRDTGRHLDDFVNALIEWEGEPMSDRVKILNSHRKGCNSWKSIEDLRQENEHLMSEIERIHAEKEKAEQECQQQRSARRNILSELGQTKQEVESLSSAQEELKRQLSEEREKEKRLKSSLTGTMDELCEANKRVEELQVKLEEKEIQTAAFLQTLTKNQEENASQEVAMTRLRGEANTWRREFQKLQRQSDRQAAQLAKTLQTLAKVRGKLCKMESTQSFMQDVVVAIDNRQEEFLQTVRATSRVSEEGRLSASRETHLVKPLIATDVWDLCQQIQHLIGSGLESFGRVLLGSKFNPADFVRAQWPSFADHVIFWQLIKTWSQSGADVSMERLWAACAVLSPDPRTVPPLAESQVQKLRAAHECLYETVNLEALLKELKRTGRVPEPVLAFLETPDVSRRRKIRCLTDVIISLGQEGPDVFLDALLESDHPHTRTIVQDILESDDEMVPDLTAHGGGEDQVEHEEMEWIHATSRRDAFEGTQATSDLCHLTSLSELIKAELQLVKRQQSDELKAVTIQLGAKMNAIGDNLKEVEGLVQNVKDTVDHFC